MLATCICLNVSLLDQLCCTIFNLFAVYLCIWSNKYVCLSICRQLVEYIGELIEDARTNTLDHKNDKETIMNKKYET